MLSSIYAVGGLIINGGLFFSSVALLKAKRKPTSLFASSTQKSATAVAATTIKLGKFEATIRDETTVYISPDYKQNADAEVDIHIRS